MYLTKGNFFLVFLTMILFFLIIYNINIAVIAQLVERIHGKDEVAGSIPAVGSTKKTTHMSYFFLGFILGEVGLIIYQTWIVYLNYRSRL
jgi:hypothetical protein